MPDAKFPVIAIAGAVDQAFFRGEGFLGAEHAVPFRFVAQIAIAIAVHGGDHEEVQLFFSRFAHGGIGGSCGEGCGGGEGSEAAQAENCEGDLFRHGTILGVI